jgi:hypothetical protein
MDGIDEAVTCHWITPTRLLPSPYSFEANIRPWSCLLDDRARPLNGPELRQCAVCVRWLPRGFGSVKRDLVSATSGADRKARRRYDEKRRALLAETWGGT